MKLLTISLLIVVTLILLGCTSSPSICGDNICSPTENSYTCQEDCGEPTTTCGDNICQENENYYTCSEDCNPPTEEETPSPPISAQQICIDNDAQLGNPEQQSTQASFVIYSKSICNEQETSSPCYETHTYVDKCTTGTTLQEQVCENNLPKTIEINCNCNEGKCE